MKITAKMQHFILALCIALPQYAFAAQPSNMQQVWNKYKIAIIAAGAGVLALLGIGSGVAAHKYTQGESLQEIQGKVDTAGLNPKTFPEHDIVHGRQSIKALHASDIDIINEGINAHDPGTGDTALIRAVQQQNVPMVKYLLKNGADIGIANNHGETPAIIAYKFNNHEILNLLNKANK